MCADERDRVEAVARVAAKAEEAVYACLDVLPLEGSATTGYRVAECIHSQVLATPEEWACAAQSIAELFAALAAADAVPAGAGEAMRCTHLYACPCSECVGEEAVEPDKVSAGEAVNPPDAWEIEVCTRTGAWPEWECGGYECENGCKTRAVRVIHAGAAEELAAALEGLVGPRREVGVLQNVPEREIRARKALARFRDGGGEE